MTMMMTSSQFGLEDMEALLWEPSTPMADVMGSLFYNPDQEEHPKIGGTLSEGNTSPVSPLTSSSLSSSSSPPPFYSPPPSPMAVLHPDKDGNESDMLSVPWLVNPEQPRCNQMVSDDRKEDVFGDLGWMTEKMDLSEIDLESLIGSCSPTEESPNSTEDLLASLECSMELDSLPMPTLSATEFSSPPSASLPSAPPATLPTVSNEASVIIVNDSESFIDEQESPSSSICVPEPEEELEIKSEPASPESSTPVVESPPSSVYTLDLGSEVDVSESEVKPLLATVIPQVQRLVFSLSPTRIVLVLAPRNEVGVTTTTVTTTSEVARSSPPASPVAHSPQRSSRGRPYPEPKYRASPPSPSVASVNFKSLQGSDEEDDDDGDDERVSLKAPKNKKMKKMEQNKTAATRYRQKKRAEQEALITEHAQMERKNVELKEKAESMAREIEYLKELIEEVRLARIKKGLGPDL